MAQFNIDIPGVGKVTVDGNFATEDSINRLVAAIKGGRGGSSRSTLNDISRYGDDVADRLHSLDPALRQNEKAVKKGTKSLNQFSQGFSKVDGMFSDMSDPGSGTLSKLVKTVGDTVGGLTSLLGVLGPVGGAIGSIASGAIGIVTGLVTEAIGFAQGLVDINKQIHNSGIALSGGLASMKNAAEDAGIPFQQFAKTMIDNTESLKLMAGGAPGGVLAVSKSMSILTRNMKPTYQSLLAMGYTVDDVMGAMTDFGANANLIGKSLSPKELAKGTTDYLKSQQELNRLTGIDIKQAREKAREQNKSLFVQKQLNRFQDPERRKAASSLLMAAEQIGIDDFVATGSSMSQTSGIMVDNQRQAATALRSLFVSLDDNQISIEDFNKRLKDILADPSLEAGVRAAIDTFGNVKGDLYKNFPISELETYLDNARRMNNAAKVAGDKFNYFTEKLAPTDKALASVEQTVTTLNSAMTTLGFALFGYVTPYMTKGAEAVESMSGKAQDFLKNIDQLNVAQQELAAMGKDASKSEIDAKKSQIQDLQKKIDSAFGTTGTSGPFDALSTMIGDQITDMTTRLSNTLSSFTDEFMYKFDNLLGSILPGYTSAYENIQGIYEESKKKTVGSTITGEPKYEDIPGGGYGEFDLSGGQVQTNKDETDLYEKLKGLSPSELSALGFVKDGAGFKRVELPGKVDIEDIARKKAPKKALGGIFNYKPGGELVTVAEAGPEVVAPAKRTKEGKLGLEVSGAQLDSSQLLRSLVEINKGQADLMASLNGKIDKLVNEQRQANRLSV